MHWATTPFHFFFFFAYMYLYLNIYFDLVLFSLEGVWGWLIPTVQAVTITDGVEVVRVQFLLLSLVNVMRIVSLKHWISGENYRYETFVSMNNKIFWHKMYSSGHCFPEHWNYWYQVYDSGKKGKKANPPVSKVSVFIKRGIIMCFLVENCGMLTDVSWISFM